MIRRLLSWLLCPHERRTMPRRRDDDSFYQRCLECGREVESRWRFEVVDYPRPDGLRVETAIEREQREQVADRGKQLAEETDEWLRRR